MASETSPKTAAGVTRRNFIAATGAAALFLGGKAPAIGAGKRKLRYIAFINRNTVWGKPYDFLAAEVDRLSGGELEIEYAGGSDVIGGFDAPEAIANGVFDMSHSANSLRPLFPLAIVGNGSSPTVERNPRGTTLPRARKFPRI